MMPAAIGAVVSAIQSLDGFLDDQIAHLGDEDLAETWRAAVRLCEAAEGLHHKLRSAYADRIIAASHQKG